MAEAELAAITASGTRALHRRQIGTAMIPENPNLALASIAQRRGHDHSAAGALPVPIPKPGDHAADADGWGAPWQSPGSWMIEAPLRSADDLAPPLKPALGSSAPITQQTDAWVCFGIKAADAGAPFECSCTLGTRVMNGGHGSRSVIENAGCLIVCRERNGRFSVFWSALVSGIAASHPCCRRRGA